MERLEKIQGPYWDKVFVSEKQTFPSGSRTTTWCFSNSLHDAPVSLQKESQYLKRKIQTFTFWSFFFFFLTEKPHIPLTRNSKSKKSYWFFLQSHYPKTITADSLENWSLSRDSFQSRALEADGQGLAHGNWVALGQCFHLSILQLPNLQERAIAPTKQDGLRSLQDNTVPGTW